MKHRWKGPALILFAFTFPAAAIADDLTGQQLILCTAVQVAVCEDGGDCDIETPGELNVPQFIQVNLKEKKLATTPASGENRSTPIGMVLRQDGNIYSRASRAAAPTASSSPRRRERSWSRSRVTGRP